MMNKRQELQCSFPTESALYAAYMSFVIGGGLFIRTLQYYPLGTVLHLAIQLMHEDEVNEIEGKVVWITPKGAQDNKMPGIGVQFLSEKSHSLCGKIETYLADMLKSSQLTDTL